MIKVVNEPMPEQKIAPQPKPLKETPVKTQIKELKDVCKIPQI